MIQELRTYTVPDGRMPEVICLFEEVLFDVFRRSGIKVVFFGTKKDSSRLVYACEFENETAKSAAWEAFFADPAWISAWSERSDPNNPMVSDVLSEVVIPVPFSS
ncbi:NIPSNAP family protein [Gammaproteobacteria bacterium]|nr:NIPSNAP family protein [Gammaproteobacteria bacterium]